MEEKLLEFLKSNQRNQWVKTKSINVYLRKGIHAVCGSTHSFLDIANIEVKPQYRRRGRFRDFLKLCQHYTPYDGLYIENIHSKILMEYFYRLQKDDERWVEDGANFIWVKR